MDVNKALEATQHLIDIVPFLGSRTSREDYNEAIELIEYLIEHKPDHPLVGILSTQIDAYENSAPEFAEFNARQAETPGGVALLRILMDQYKLKQTDFTGEIGSRSLVSRILKGERSLTLEHMRALARRFSLPVSAFVD